MPNDADLKKARREKARLLDPLKSSQLPPHSEEAERGVLGCILLAPVDSLAECVARGITPAHFYDLRHQQIFHAIRALEDAGKPIDTLSLYQWLRDHLEGAIEKVGGLPYLSDLPDKTPFAGHVGHYLDILREKYLRRRALALCADVVGRVYEEDSGDADQLLEQLQNDSLELTEGTVEQRAVTFKQLLPRVIDDLEDGYHRGSAQIKGITTGLPYLDKILCGMGQDQGNFYVLAARPGDGKTALAMQIAVHIARVHKWFTPEMDSAGKPVRTTEGKPKWVEHRGLPVGVFSLEMSGRIVLRRAMFQHSGVDAQRFNTGFASERDFHRLQLAAPVLNSLPIYIDDTDSLTIEGLAARARQMVRQYGIKLFIVDYIQCLQVATKRFRPDRVQEMAEISNGLRRLTKQLNLPFVVLAQMNRDFSKEKGIRKPRLEDLRDSGAIEQDAEVVAFLYRQDLSDEKQKAFEEQMETVFGADCMRDWSAKPRLLNLLVAKNRHGISNKGVELMFDGSCQQFHDYQHWLKAHDLKPLAAGERSKKKGTNDDML